MDPEVLAAHGAFATSLVSDLPLLVDPLLLFNSDDPAYQTLHQAILRYLFFLRDQASAGLDEELIRSSANCETCKAGFAGVQPTWASGSQSQAARAS